MTAYVKTTYKKNEFTQETPITNYQEYANKEEAETFIKICLKWGLGIASCGLVTKEQMIIEKGYEP